MDAHHSDGGCWAARGRAAQERRPPPGGLRRGASIAVHTSSKRSMRTVLGAWALVVMDAAAPRYACCGWGGPSDGHGREKGLERPTQSDRHTTASGDTHER